MRLTRLDRPVQFLKGVGPKRGEHLRRMGILTARDLLYHVPRRYDDASTITPVAAARVGMDVTAIGEVRSKGIVPTRTGLRIFQAVIQDDSGLVTCSWPGQPWVERSVKRGDRILVTGPVKFFHGRQIHPREHAVLERASPDRGRSPTGRDTPTGAETPSDDSPGTIFCTYPASESVPPWVFRRLFKVNLDWLLAQIDADEYLTADDRRELGLIELSTALRDLHRPRAMAEVARARRRVAFDELFFLQLMQARIRHDATRERPGIAFVRTNRLIRALHASLPFQLTGAQARVLREIYADMTSSHRMNRMLQGDVGSGKTLVALFAMLLAVEGGRQAALMAPTEILAEQHADRIRKFLRDVSCSVELLTGSITGRSRARARARIATGVADVVVGTHALIQEGVEFRAPGLVVIDEQHRFGVRQRMALAEREPQPDTLSMSATPIPRSLAMTLEGDLDLSIIDELPPGRVPVVTRLVGPAERPRVLREINRRLDRGGQAYFVYPLIEESEQVDLLAAETEFQRLRDGDLAGRKLALLHGRLAGDEKDRIMRTFQRGDVDVLVATTVIEVGIDVPNATTMVIENAQRFGLSQLHQLRGRIGRGDQGGLCIAIGERSARLDVFARTNDGFEIAAEDLRIRGQGDFFGAEQHGFGTDLKFADLIEHDDLVQLARNRARAMIDVDPQLAAASHSLVRNHLERRYGDRAKLFHAG